jgi:hypothetical protein
MPLNLGNVLLNPMNIKNAYYPALWSGIMVSTNITISGCYIDIVIGHPLLITGATDGRYELIYNYRITINHLNDIE